MLSSGSDVAPIMQVAIHRSPASSHVSLAAPSPEAKRRLAVVPRVLTKRSSSALKALLYRTLTAFQMSDLVPMVATILFAESNPQCARQKFVKVGPTPAYATFKKRSPACLLLYVRSQPFSVVSPSYPRRSSTAIPHSRICSRISATTRAFSCAGSRSWLVNIALAWPSSS